MTTKILTLAEFRASGRDVEDLADHAGDDESRPGRVYAGGCYIDENEGPQGKYHESEPYHLQIERSEWCGKLADLEEILYNEWYVPECSGGRAC